MKKLKEMTMKELLVLRTKTQEASDEAVEKFSKTYWQEHEKPLSVVALGKNSKKLLDKQSAIRTDYITKSYDVSKPYNETLRDIRIELNSRFMCFWEDTDTPSYFVNLCKQYFQEIMKAVESKRATRTDKEIYERYSYYLAKMKYEGKIVDVPKYREQLKTKLEEYRKIINTLLEEFSTVATKEVPTDLDITYKTMLSEIAFWCLHSQIKGVRYDDLFEDCTEGNQYIINPSPGGDPRDTDINRHLSDFWREISLVYDLIIKVKS